MNTVGKSLIMKSSPVLFDSATGLESRIRWLRGLKCKGSETKILDCGPHTWGQIGVCDWNSVAAVICTNQQGMWGLLNI